MKLNSVRFQTKLLIRFNPALLLAPMTAITLAILGTSLMYVSLCVHESASYWLTPLHALIIVFLDSYAEGMAPLANMYSFSDALWCAVITGSSTGYGRFYPVTQQGMMIAQKFESSVMRMLILSFYYRSGSNSFVRNGGRVYVVGICHGLCFGGARV